MARPSTPRRDWWELEQEARIRDCEATGSHTWGWPPCQACCPHSGVGPGQRCPRCEGRLMGTYRGEDQLALDLENDAEEGR